MKKIAVGVIAFLIFIFLFIKIASDDLDRSTKKAFCEYMENYYGCEVKKIKMEDGYHYGSMDLTYYYVTGLIDGGENDGDYVLALITEPGKSYGKYYDTDCEVLGCFDTRKEAIQYYNTTPNL